MTDEEKYSAARLKDLSKQSEGKCIWTYSDFLTLAEQELIHTVAYGEYILFGGYEAAERQIAIFGSEDLCGYKASPPIAIIKIEPASKKFADKLTHRDFLGSLMALGIKRSTLGDIVVGENEAYLFCIDTVAGFICDNLIQIKRTTVRCTIIEEAPEITANSGEPSDFLTASERLDAIVAAVYKLSRSDSKLLIEQGKAFVNSRVCSSPDAQPETGDIVSVRGKGRFKYMGVSRQTKKGKLSISAVVF